MKIINITFFTIIVMLAMFGTTVVYAQQATEPEQAEATPQQTTSSEST